MAGPEVKVKVGADTSGLDKGLKGAESRLAAFGGVAKVAGGIVAATGAAVIALTKASLANIDATAKMARSIGLSTSALQDMSLVAKEAGVDTGKLTSMLGLMQRNISELQKGTKLQTEAFASMGLTIADLQGLSPDEQFRRIAEAMDAITDPTEKTARAMEVFGRGGREAINMLSGYSQRIAEAEEFNRRFGITVGQDVAEGVERANDAVGRIGMVFQGLGNVLAGFVAPAIEATANAIVAFAGHVVGARVTLEDFFGTLENARATLGEEVFNRLLGNPAEIAKYAPEVATLADETLNLSVAATQTANSLQSMAAELERQRAGAIAGEFMDLARSIQEARDELDAKIISAEQFKERMAEAKEESDRLTAALEAADGAGFDGVIGRLGSLWDAVNAVANEAARMNANLDPSTLETVEGGTIVGTPALGTPGGPVLGFGSVTGGARPDNLFGGMTPGNPGGGGRGGGGGGRGGGGGGGGAGPMAARLEALQAALATESEIVQAWYDESLDTLTSAMDRQMLTEEEYRALRERLEQEHQDRLAGIREIGNESAVSAALGAGEEILSAIGQTNRRALKIAKVFGAGQALISAYQGAAEALKLPFPKNIAAAASVLAKGIGFVNAIRSVNESGSGGGGGSAGGGGTVAAAQAPAQQPLDVMLNTYGPGEFIRGADFGMMLDRLNEVAGDRGYRLMMGT